jgi:hypothetical protein
VDSRSWEVRSHKVETATSKGTPSASYEMKLRHQQPSVSRTVDSMDPDIHRIAAVVGTACYYCLLCISFVYLPSVTSPSLKPS